MAYHKITPKEMERFHALYESGLRDGAIAEALGVCRETVFRWRQERGLPSKNGRGVRVYATPEEKKRAQAEQKKRNAAYYISRQRCVLCHTQDAFTLNGRHYCAECTEKMYARCRKNRERPEVMQAVRDSQRRHNAERRAAGLCVACGRKTQDGKSYCARCAARKNAQTQKRRIESGVNYPRGDNGFCWKCNKVPAAEGMRLCADCAAKASDVLEQYARPARQMKPLIFGRLRYGKADADAT